MRERDGVKRSTQPIQNRPVLRSAAEQALAADTGPALLSAQAEDTQLPAPHR